MSRLRHAWAMLMVLVSCLSGTMLQRATAADGIGSELQKSFFWSPDWQKPETRFVAFRHDLTITEPLREAKLHLFADARYMLWLNGQYITAGPCRFETSGPEYDTHDIRSLLKPGRNSIVILALGNNGPAQNGRMRRHLPGLTACFELNGKIQTPTISGWKCSGDIHYRPPLVDWANLTDRIDFRVEDGDWTAPDYDDQRWTSAVSMDGSTWGPLTARSIPLLKDTPPPCHLSRDEKLPRTLSAGESLEFRLDRFSQVYTVLDFTAENEAEIHLDYPSSTLERMDGRDHGDAGIPCIARAGRQCYISSDSRGLLNGSIRVKSGKITIHRFELVERLYPFEVRGSFESSDEMLNRLWKMCARSCQLLSEDAYVDCADRERVEWMDSDPPAYDITRTALAGAGSSSIDSRLYGAMLRRTALSIQPEGWVKAHTCSDRFDIHAKMEDRACDWVQGLRRYHDSTGDTALIREIWPMVVKQMDWFLARRTSRGLIQAREWIVWGNPIGYLTCEGAGLNAFAYRALQDAAHLGDILHDEESSKRFSNAAAQLKKTFNEALWDEASGSYFSACYNDATAALPENRNRQPKLKRLDDRLEPTMFSCLWALDQGIVPDERKERVTRYLLDHRQDARRIMTYYYLFKQLYAQHSDSLDKEVLDTLRMKWKPMVDDPMQSSWEEFDGGSKAHIYGIFPGYFLSAYVLGIRPEMPASSKQILIEPHLGDLTQAKGIVMTESGPVSVAWRKSGSGLDFSIKLPHSVSATLSLPATPENRCLINGKPQTSTSTQRFTLTLKGGNYEGSLRRTSPH